MNFCDYRPNNFTYLQGQRRILKAMNSNIRIRAALTLIVIFIVSNSFSQNNLHKNSVYYELYGTGLGFVSIHYERQFPISDKLIFAPGIGFSLTKTVHVGGTKNWGDQQIFIPVEVNFLIGKNDHKFELGYGMPFALRDKEFGFVSNIYLLRFGYRYQAKNGFMLRASVNPGVQVIIPVLWAGLGIGFSF